MTQRGPAPRSRNRVCGYDLAVRQQVSISADSVSDTDPELRWLLTLPRRRPGPHRWPFPCGQACAPSPGSSACASPPWCAAPDSRGWGVASTRCSLTFTRGSRSWERGGPLTMADDTMDATW